MGSGSLALWVDLLAASTGRIGGTMGSQAGSGTFNISYLSIGQLCATTCTAPHRTTPHHTTSRHTTPHHATPHHTTPHLTPPNPTHIIRPTPPPRRPTNAHPPPMPIHLFPSYPPYLAPLHFIPPRPGQPYIALPHTTSPYPLPTLSLPLCPQVTPEVQSCVDKKSRESHRLETKARARGGVSTIGKKRQTSSVRGSPLSVQDPLYL